MLRWADNNLLDLKWEEIGEHYGRYRLHVPEAERAMARSLERYGQLSPVVVCRRQDRYELIDGFKRLGAVRGLAQIPRLSARLMEADERHGEGGHLRAESRRGPDAGTGRSLDYPGAGAGRRIEPGGGGGTVGTPQELGVPPAGPDRTLGTRRRVRNCAWACCRPPPRGRWCGCRRATRPRFSEAIRREALSGAELTGVVDLLLHAPAAISRRIVLAQPREALSQAQGFLPAVRDPRLSEAGNQVGKRLGVLAGPAGTHGSVAGAPWSHRADAGGSRDLSPRFQRLARDAGSVAALSRDFVGELERA